MKRELGPTWSVEDCEAGELFAQASEKHFRAAEEGHPPEPAVAFSRDTTVTQVVNRQGPALMRYPNVVGVSEGVRMRAGRPTGESSLIVHVERKIPRHQLGEDEVLPSEVDGVPADVVEVGVIEPLPVPPKSKR